MKAIVFDASGAPNVVLRCENVPVPTPEAGQVRVKVAASPINPADVAFIRGVYRIKPTSPQVAGLEGAGIVEEVGAGAENWLGRCVAFRWPGAWADYVVVPAERLIAVPEGIDLETAAQISLNPLTAVGLVQTSGVTAGESLLLTAARSTVSTLAAQIAREKGIKTIGLVRGQANGSACDVVLSADDPQLVPALTAAGQNGINGLLDSVGGPLVPRLFSTLAAGATVVAYGVQDAQPMQVSNAMLIYANLTWVGFGIDRWLALRGDAVQDDIKLAWSLIERKVITLPVQTRFEMGDIEAAFAADGAAGRAGKVLFVPDR
ncbi:zinc-binding dehydrogenase [Roseiarcaceae bacterium H3SJ34-1]|uniref:quinone oxidoreductase family protein n=1 Tax=Terripilifer ovatus TaxID=3032367 RepID=UPI003AB94CD9|nr:zinc-binding dehydrogenase [Roseiarcaceae bacterium H3SJ34-1]